MNYKLSMYTHLLREANRIIMYNTWSEKIVCIQPAIRIEEILSNDNLEFSAVKQFLIGKQFFVPETEDEKSKGLLKYYDMVFDRALSLTLLASEQCNFRCSYCYESFSKGAMKQKVVDGLIRYLQKNLSTYSKLSVDWFGGEPLLAMDVIENFSKRVLSIAQMAKKPYVAGMTTNGYLLTVEVIKKLMEYRVFSFQITIDGTQNHHDRYRKLANQSGTFDTIMHNLRKIRDEVTSPLLRISIRSNITSENLCAIDEYIDFMQNEFGSDHRFSFFFRPTGDWGGSAVKELHPTLLESSDSILKNVLAGTDGDKKLNLSTYSSLLNTGICYAGVRNNYIIGSDGIIYKCTLNFDKEVNQIGQVQENGVFDIDYSRLAKWIMPGVLPQKCDGCYSYLTCPGGQCVAQRLKKDEKRDINCGYERSNINDTLRLICDNTNQYTLFDLKGATSNEFKY